MRDPRTILRSRRTSGTFASLGVIVRKQSFRQSAVLHICGAFLTYASGAWLPAFLIRVHHLSVAEAGVISAIAIGLGGAIGTLGGGVICDRVARHVPNGETRIIQASFLLAVPALAVVVFSHDETVAVGACFLFSIAAYAWLAPTITLVQKSVDAEHRALSTGTSGAIANILSLGIGVPAIGALSDILARTGGPASLGYALFFGILLVVLVGTSTLHATAARTSRERNLPALQGE